MRRGGPAKMVRRAFQHEGPMTDAKLAWRLKSFGVNPSTAKRVRGVLTKRNEVRFTGRVRITEDGRLQKIWELAPVPQ